MFSKRVLQSLKSVNKIKKSRDLTPTCQIGYRVQYLFCPQKYENSCKQKKCETHPSDNNEPSAQSDDRSIWISDEPSDQSYG